MGKGPILYVRWRTTMHIRPATPSDLDGALAVYKSARAFMRETGNPNQWGDSFPPRERVEGDIQTGALRVCVDGNGDVLGCFAFLPGPEPDYARIYNGSWPNDKPYDLVHRFAVLRQGRGVGGAMLDWALEHGRNLRVDTHRDNKPMQGLLASRGFTYCGIIKLGRNGDERLAYVRCDPRP